MIVKKHDLKKLALMGIAGGLLLTKSTGLLAADPQAPTTATKTPADASSSKTSKDNGNNESQSDDYSQSSDDDPNSSNLNYHLMTEEELKLELNEEGLKMYNSLDDKNKELAREVASMRCKNSNPCSHLNACKTPQNDCAGKSSTCKHTGKCAVPDKNLAVKLVYDKMKDKRMGALKDNSSSP